VSPWFYNLIGFGERALPAPVAGRWVTVVKTEETGGGSEERVEGNGTAKRVSKPTETKRRGRIWVPVVGCSLVLVGFLGWWRSWFGEEPTYHGKTVTEWCDSMALFDEDRNAELTGQNVFLWVAKSLSGKEMIDWR
jgi:hypothetical protein